MLDLLYSFIACCLGEEKGWQHLEREECMVQQLNNGMYMLLNFAVMVIGYVYGITPPRALYA